MTKQELIALCEKFQTGDIGTFRKIVAEFLKMNKNNDRIMAERWGIAPSTVRRWVNGIARPAPSLQKLIIAEIIKICQR